MFGFQKSKQGKSVEEFLSGGQGSGTVAAEGGGADKRADAPKAGRWLIPATIVAGVLFVLCFVAFARIDRLGRDVAQLGAQVDRKAFEDVKAQVAALNARLEKSGRETGQLKGDIARLRRDLQAMNAANARKAKAETKTEAVKKRPADKKKAGRGKRHATAG